MATGVKPRDEETKLTRSDLEAIQEAMKNKKFRDLLVDYCEEVRDPANQAIYQKEMTQLEKERGYDITFINPKGGYVIKTSVAGDRKAFINICSNENIAKPSCSVQEVAGQKGMNWQLPYSIIPPREEYDHKRKRCVVYDVVFHPDTLRMAEVNKRFRELVNKTAYEGLQKTYNIQFDSNNFRFPKSHYKGVHVPAVIRKEDPNYKPANYDESQDMSPDILEKLYPQRNYSENETDNTKLKRKTNIMSQSEFTHTSHSGYTVPKYVIKQQKNIEFQDFTYHKDSKHYAAIPSYIAVEINLPLLSSTTNCILDVREKSLSLQSEKPAKYKLDITLPYHVNDELGHAKFDKSRRMLLVTLPVRKLNIASDNTNSKVDSGVESEENSGSQSDDDLTESKVIELSASVKTQSNNVADVENCVEHNAPSFFDDSFTYILPTYTHNVLDDVVAFTFHVKNTEPDSVKVEKVESKVFVKFTTVGAGFVPVHYAAIIKFDDDVKFDNVSGEAWDNNVILQLELVGDAPQKFDIGLTEDSMNSEEFDMSQVTKTIKTNAQEVKEPKLEASLPVFEVTNLGNETNIVVSSNPIEDEDDLDEDDIESPTAHEKEIVWTESETCENGAKSILRKPLMMMRSFSESSGGDVASSMDYISSDCIPEESSFKKTVRFNHVIARQFYRYNSSIEGQKKKNQRKKSKKRNQNRSESEAEDEVITSGKNSKSRLKSALMKPRRDSGLADTSDAEEYKNSPVYMESYDPVNVNKKDANGNIASNNNSITIEKDAMKSVLNVVNNKHDDQNNHEPTIWKSKDEPSKKRQEKKTEPITYSNIKHNTDLYNPDKLNKGKYLEVSFKNDLIFDLDM